MARDRESSDDRGLFERWYSAGCPTLSDFATISKTPYGTVLVASEQENWRARAQDLSRAEAEATLAVVRGRSVSRIDRVTQALDGMIDLINRSVASHLEQSRLIPPGQIAKAVQSMVDLARVADEANLRKSRVIDVSGLSTDTLRELANLLPDEDGEDL